MKLRLPHRFQAALLAAIASVSFTTLSSGTLAAAAAAALLAGQQAQAQVTGIHPMQEVVVAGETYTTTTENGILVAEGNNGDGTAINLSPYTSAEYLVLTSTTNGRYKVNATANLQNFGTVVLAAGSYQGEGGAVNFNGGQIFVNGGVTLTNDFIIGTSGYVEGGYDGAFRLSGNNTFAGSLTLVQDAKMTVVGSSTVQGVVSGAGKTLTLGQGGSLTFNNQTTLGGLAMGSASATFNGAAAAKNSIGTVTSNASTTLTLFNTDATIGGDQSFKGNLYIGSGSTVTVIKNDSLGYSVTDTITVAEGGTLTFGNKRWTLGANNTIVMAGGTITGTGDGANGTLDYYANGGVLRATKTSTVAAPIRLRNSDQITTFDVVKDAELTIDGIINGNGNLAKAGAGVLVLKKNATYGGSTSLQGGTLKIATGATLNEGVFTMANGATFVNDGTATIGKVGSASTLGGTLTNTGTLNLAGDITVNTDVATSFEVAAAGEKTYSGGTSGYLSSDTTTYYLVHTTGGTVTNNANITGVSNLTFDEGTGNITFTRNATGSGIYYVNEDLPYNAETMGAATGFAIAAGATLISDGSSYSPGKALHGAGTYALSTNTVTLNGGLTLGTDWAGTVRITDASGNLVNFGNLVNGTQSTLELKGFSGYTTTWFQGAGSGVHTQNLKLTNGTNGYAWRSTGSTSGDGNTAIFSGTWSGDGVFQTQCNKLNFRYEGDISAWEGTFHVNTGIPTLTFAKQATEVNATIEKGGGSLYVVADTDVQFNKAITANTFTVNAGKTVTLAPAANDATYNVGSITNNGTIAVAAGKNASFLVSNNLSFGNVLVNNGGTLAVRGDSASRTFSFNELAVSGTGHLSNLGSASGGVGYQSTINIANLTNTGESAVLTMGNAARSSATVINLNGGAFSGEIILRGEADNGTRLTGYQFNAAGVAADSIVTFDVLSGKAGNNSLGMGVGADITVQGIRHAEGVSVTSTIYSGNVNAGASSFDSQGDVVHTITIAGAGEYATSATVKNHVNLVMNGQGTQTFSGDMSAFDGTITVNAGTLALTGTVGQSAGAATVNGGTLELNNMNVSGAVTLSSGTLDITSTLSAGSFTMDGGTLKLSQERGLTSSTGSLAFNSGTLDLSGLQVVAGTDYTLASSTGGTVTLGGVNFSLSSPALKDQYELTVQGGNTLVLSYTQSSNELIWDNDSTSGKWNTTDRNWHVGTAAAGTSQFKANDDVKFTSATPNAVVSMEGAITAGSVTVANGANVTIATISGNTLNATGGITVENGATMSLQGTGVTGELSGAGVVVGNAISSTGTWNKAQVLGSDVRFGDSWTGTVKLTRTGNAEFQNMDLNEFGRGGSKVEIDGVSGYFRQEAADHFSPEVVLGTNGLNIGNGYSTLKDKTTPTKYYFDGGVSGAGNMEFNKTTQGIVTQHLYFTGDVKGWSGNLKVVNNFIVYANFSGNADTVNAGINRTGGELHLEVGDGSTSFTTTFNKAVSATDLTVANNATAAFGQNATLTTTGDVTLNGTLDLGAMTSAASVGGVLKLNDGSVLKFSGAAQNLLQVGSFTVNSSSALDMSAITFNRETSTYTLLSSTSAIDSSVLSALTVTGVTDPLGRAYELGLQGNALTLTFSEPPMPEFGNDLGKVMYIGDSITDGEAEQKSWRYSFFKILADEGIAQVEEGYFQSTQTSGQITTASYGDRTFTNTHSAHTSARSTQTVGSRTGRYDNSNIMNWLGQSTVKTDGGNYTSAVYDGSAAPDTFFVLLGTNDTLSEDKGHMSETFYNQVINTMYGYSNESFDGKSGTFDKMYASMMEANPDAKVIILEIPTWSPNHNNNNYAEDFAYIGRVNQKLHEWAASKNNSNITIVKSDTGIVDVANTEKPGSGVVRMFADGLHPSAQGELLIAGNVAKALGYGGRTMGQERKGAGTFTNLNIIPEQGATISTTWEAAGVDVTGSFTVDISSLMVGNGYGDSSWDTSNVLTITVGDGVQQGVLNVNEAYIKWGNDILYSYDMSDNLDSLRISYITGGDLPSGYSAGYYVWLGDMMIGESLMSTTGATDGVSVAWTGSTSVTMGKVSGTAGAYAPSLGAGHYENAANLYLVNSTSAIIPWVQPTDDSIGYTGLGLTASGNYVAGAHASPVSGHSGNGVYTSVTGGTGVGTLYANKNDHTGDVYMLVNGVTMSGSETYGWIAAHNSNTLTGNASVKVENSGNSKAMLFGTVSGNISGNVYTEVNGGTFASYSKSNRASYAGSYQGNITRLATLLTTGGVFEDSVFGGVHNSNNNNYVGSTLLDLRGGLFKGNVYGGGAAGTVNNGTSVVISGDAVVNGDVYGGGTGGTVNGGTTITLAGGLVRGSVYGGGAGGTVNGDTKVVLKDGAAVAGNIYGMTDTDQGGTVEFYATTGYRSTTLVLAQTVAFTNGATGTYASDFNVETVTLAGASQVTLNNLTFTACTMEIGEGSALTLDGTLTLPKAANYSGSLALTDGMTLDLSRMQLTGYEEGPVTLLSSNNGALTYHDLTSYDLNLGHAEYDSYSLSVDSGNNLVLTFTPPTPADSLIWDGTQNSNWSTNPDDQNWHAYEESPGTSAFTTDSKVTFNEGTPSVVLTEDISSGNIAVRDGANVTLHTDPLVARVLETPRLSVADGSTLTVDANVALTTGTITGSGTVSLRDGTKLVLTDGVDNNGTLNVGSGAIVKLAGTGDDMLAVQNLKFADVAVLDVSNIVIPDGVSSVKIADIDGRLDFHSLRMGTSESSGHYVDLVTVANYQGGPTDVVYLKYEGTRHEGVGVYYFTDAELYLVKEAAGLYWNNRDDNGKLMGGVWQPAQTERGVAGIANWNAELTSDTEQNPNVVTEITTPLYFITETPDQEITIQVDRAYEGSGVYQHMQATTIVVGGGGTFNFERLEPTTAQGINQTPNLPSHLIVRKNTTAHFELDVKSGEFSQTVIETGAQLDLFDVTGSAGGPNSTYNQGTFNMSFPGYMYAKNIVNEGTANIGRVWDAEGHVIIETSEQPFFLFAEEIYNEAGATMTLAAEYVSPMKPSDTIVNEGELIFRTDDTLYDMGVNVSIPIEGMGAVTTVGTDSATFSSTVDGSMLNTGAKSTTFNKRVTITDTTTLTAEDFVEDEDKRSTTTFNYSSQLGEHVVMGGNTTLDLNTGSEENPVYTMGEVTSTGDDQVLIVRSGVTANVADGVSLGEGKAQIAGSGKLTIGGATSSVEELAATGGGTALVELNGSNANEAPVLNAKKLSNENGTTLRVLNTDTENARTAQFNIGDEASASSSNYSGALQYGVGANAASDSGMELTIKDNNVAAGAELKAYYDEDAPQSASVNVVVDTAAAKVVGLSDNISGPDADRSMSVSGSGKNTAETGNNGLEITGNDDYEYAGTLGAKLDIAYTGDGSQTIQGGVSNFNGAVTVDNGTTEEGVLAILNASSVSITDLTIGANDKLNVKQDDQGSQADGMTTVTGTLTARGGSGNASKLDSNLTMVDGSTFDVSAAGGQGGLNLTGTLTINDGAQLSTDDLLGVKDLGWFEMYDLAFGVTDMIGFGQVDWSEGVDVTEVFANTGLKAEEYYVRYSGAGTAGGNGDNVGAVYIYHIPEPTTSTLSLLALMALAARRRRK